MAMALFARKHDNTLGCGTRRRTLPLQRRALLLAAVGVAALALALLGAPEPDGVGDDGGEGDASLRRALLASVGGDVFGDAALLAIPGDGAWDLLSDAHHQAADAAAGVELDNTVPHAQLLNADRSFPPYTLQDAVGVAKMYHAGFALLVYDPADDAFQVLYFNRHPRVESRHSKLMKTVQLLTQVLRKSSPDRFQGKDSPELVIPISAGDDPGVKYGCLENLRHPDREPLAPQEWHAAAAARPDCLHHAPVLQFGSVFRDAHVFPNMLGMPMPGAEGFQDCFATWAHKGRPCWSWRAVPDQKHWDNLKAKGTLGLVYGEEFGLVWEDLVPQVAWRGTDYPFIHGLNPTLSRPKRRLSEEAKEETKEDAQKLKEDREAAVKSMREQYGDLLPRWQAVVLTAEAEVEAEVESSSKRHFWTHDDTGRTANALPWANMKLAGKHFKGADYKKWEALGFVTGEPMDLPTLATYKYQIDLGGAGGTSSTGTLQKLAMPGLLFHHMTATKDFVHDWMTPWVHYVPVAADLGDLKDKVEWAKGNPERAKLIADEGTKLARYLTGREGLADMFERAMLAPLRSATDAYQPLNTELLDHNGDGSWMSVTEHLEGRGGVFPVTTCKGDSASSCTPPEAWIKHMRKGAKGKGEKVAKEKSSEK